MYEEYMKKADEQSTLALKAANKGDFNMARFHRNAAEGFKMKARALSVEKA